MYTNCGMYDCAVDWVSLDPELLSESNMDITWYTPQSVHFSSCCRLVSTVSKAGAGLIVLIDESSIGVGEADPIAAVDDDAVGVVDVGPIATVDDDAIGIVVVDPIAVVDDDAIGIVVVDPIAVVGEGTLEVDSGSTSTRFAGARIEGRKVPYLLT